MSLAQDLLGPLIKDNYCRYCGSNINEKNINIQESRKNLSTETYKWRWRGYLWIPVLILYIFITITFTILISFSGIGQTEGEVNLFLNSFPVFMMIIFLIFTAVTDRGGWNRVIRFFWVTGCWIFHALISVLFSFIFFFIFGDSILAIISSSVLRHKLLDIQYEWAVLVERILEKISKCKEVLDALH